MLRTGEAASSTCRAIPSLHQIPGEDRKMPVGLRIMGSLREVERNEKVLEPVFFTKDDAELKGSKGSSVSL